MKFKKTLLGIQRTFGQTFHFPVIQALGWLFFTGFGIYLLVTSYGEYLFLHIGTIAIGQFWLWAIVNRLAYEKSLMTDIGNIYIYKGVTWGYTFDPATQRHKWWELNKVNPLILYFDGSKTKSESFKALKRQLDGIPGTK